MLKCCDTGAELASLIQRKQMASPRYDSLGRRRRTYALRKIRLASHEPDRGRLVRRSTYGRRGVLAEGPGSSPVAVSILLEARHGVLKGFVL